MVEFILESFYRFIKLSPLHIELAWVTAELFGNFFLSLQNILGLPVMEVCHRFITLKTIYDGQIPMRQNIIWINLKDFAEFAYSFRDMRRFTQEPDNVLLGRKGAVFIRANLQQCQG